MPVVYLLGHLQKHHLARLQMNPLISFNPLNLPHPTSKAMQLAFQQSAREYRTKDLGTLKEKAKLFYLRAL